MGSAIASAYVNAQSDSCRSSKIPVRGIGAHLTSSEHENEKSFETNKSRKTNNNSNNVT